jgi:hypothetical protein
MKYFLPIFFFTSFLYAQNTDTDQVVTIKVVFHVLYKTQDQNISDQLIIDELNQINKDFRGSEENKSQIPSDLLSAFTDTKINFELSKYDPYGNKTTGIIRKNVSSFQDFIVTDTPYTDSHHFDSTKGGSTPFDPNRYLNIYIVFGFPFSSTGFSSYFADAGKKWDGVVIMYDQMGKRVFVHEIGHYLNLLHPWGLKGGDCPDDDWYEDDLVLDTPPQKGPLDKDASYPVDESDNGICEGYEPNPYNFMEYTDTRYMFTLGQKNRMRLALFTERKSLLDPYVFSPFGIREYKNETENQFKRIVSEDGRCEAKFNRESKPNKFEIRSLAKDSFNPQIVWETSWTNQTDEDDNFLAWNRYGQFKIITTKGGKIINKWTGGQELLNLPNGRVKLSNSGTTESPICQLVVIDDITQEMKWSNMDEEGSEVKKRILESMAFPQEGLNYLPTDSELIDYNTEPTNEKEYNYLLSEDKNLVAIKVGNEIRVVKKDKNGYFYLKNFIQNYFLQ